MTVAPQPRSATLVAGGTPNGKSGINKLVPIDAALLLLGEKVDAYRKSAGSSFTFWEKYLQEKMGLTADAAGRFVAIPRVLDAALVVTTGLGATLAPNSFPRAQAVLRYAATARAAFQATQIFSSTTVGAYTAAMTAAALLMRRNPNQPLVAKATEFFQNNPQAKRLLITWYAATCYSLYKKGHKSLISMMNVVQPREALITEPNPGAGANPAGEDDDNALGAGRFNNSMLAKAVNTLNTSRMTQTDFHVLASKAIARGKDNRATEAALWKELRELSTNYGTQENAVLVAAQQALTTATAAVTANDAAQGVDATRVAALAAAPQILRDKQLAEMRVNKLRTEIINRAMHNLPLAEQTTHKLARTTIEKAALNAAICLDIFPLLAGGAGAFMDSLPELATKYGKVEFSEALRAILPCLKDGAVLPRRWTDTQVDQFIAAVNGGGGRRFEQFQAGGDYEINADALMRLSVATYQSSSTSDAVATHQKMAVAARFPAGTLQVDPALKAKEKQELVKEAEKASDTKLSVDAVADIQAITDIARAARAPLQKNILYPEIVAMYNPNNDKELWLSQVRAEGATCHTTQAEFQKILATQNSFNGRDQGANRIVYFKINPNKILDLVLYHDIENLDFEECFYVTGMDRGAPSIAFGKPPADQERLDHRLTAELFRVVGIHHQSSLLKALLSGNLHKKTVEEIDLIRKQMKFLDWINENHFVTKLPNGAPSFMEHDTNYMNHAQAYRMIREELLTQLTHRTATIAATAAVKAKKGGAGAVIAEPQPEAAWATKATLSATMATFTTLPKVSYKKSSFLGGGYKGNNLRCRAFHNAYEGLTDSMKALQEGLDRQNNTHEALRLGVVSGAAGNRPLLESFYRHAYMLKHMLDNNHVRASVLETFEGANKVAQETQANQLSAAIDTCLTNVNNAYADHLAKVEYGAQSVHATKTEQLKVQADDFAKFYAHADFVSNGFERKAPTVVQQTKMGIARLLS